MKCIATFESTLTNPSQNIISKEARWSNWITHQAHDLKTAGSNPVLAYNKSGDACQRDK